MQPYKLGRVDMTEFINSYAQEAKLKQGGGKEVGLNDQFTTHRFENQAQEYLDTLALLSHKNIFPLATTLHHCSLNGEHWWT